MHTLCADCFLQVESERVCQTGLEEEAELQWKQDQQAALAPCQNIKHTFARIARECKDVRFFQINVSPTAQPWLWPVKVFVLRMAGANLICGCFNCSPFFHIFALAQRGVRNMMSGPSRAFCQRVRSWWDRQHRYWLFLQHGWLLLMCLVSCRRTTLMLCLCLTFWAHALVLTSAAAWLFAPYVSCRPTTPMLCLCLTSWALRCCPRCSFGGRASCCGSTGASTSWNRTWARVCCTLETGGAGRWQDLDSEVWQETVVVVQATGNGWTGTYQRVHGPGRCCLVSCVLLSGSGAVPSNEHHACMQPGRK